MQTTADHFIDHVIPAAEEYQQAEIDLSKAWQDKAGEDDPALRKAQKTAIRKASELAVALSGLVDRMSLETGVSKNAIVARIDADCFWSDGGALRERAASRVRSVADAYKHHTLDPNRHTVTTADDILALGLSFNRDGYGVGKYSGQEVFSRESENGEEWKFLGDAHVVLAAWKRLLQGQGIDLADVELPL